MSGMAENIQVELDDVMDAEKAGRQLVELLRIDHVPREFIRDVALTMLSEIGIVVIYVMDVDEWNTPATATPSF